MKTVRSRFLLLATAVLAMLLISAALIRQDKPIIHKRMILLHKVTINGKLADSIIYNAKGKLAEIWFYDDITGRWDAHNKYVYGPKDKVEKVLEYWGDELMEIDSVYYHPTGFTCYSLSRRAAAGVLTDTLRFFTNEAGKPIQIGNMDTVVYNNKAYLTYDAIQYRNANPHRHTSYDYFQTEEENQYTSHQVITEQEYDSNPNPFSPLCRDYPGIAMATFNQNILFADAANNMTKRTVTDSYSGSLSSTASETVSCSYRYDPVTQLPLEQSYIRYELNDQEKPVRKKYNIQFYYQQQ
ncbi:MAG: hypothetical protein JO154_00365 [Chitinophaga sp.]|uniref:hypothetical protein n=1 Tax=Chitinophaga sp. TaxID=1869181 RepID=UPI0025BBC2EB|nr:hypothetical protein [Chitinophaga sp.]MBV8251031.1 hypothetical protein [Chitinophaga sp.]